MSPARVSAQKGDTIPCVLLDAGSKLVPFLEMSMRRYPVGLWALWAISRPTSFAQSTVSHESRNQVARLRQLDRQSGKEADQLLLRPNNKSGAPSRQGTVIIRKTRLKTTTAPCVC